MLFLFRLQRVSDQTILDNNDMVVLYSGIPFELLMQCQCFFFEDTLWAPSIMMVHLSLSIDDGKRQHGLASQATNGTRVPPPRWAEKRPERHFPAAHRIASGCRPKT
ncbi:hypothetical protein GUJ93_ZPchr0012g20095 [Zizania palustris]|uniref:Uncharacterized protein n=1 Tax=Zizania palustris TaxID=103762 RepID=A0A8J6BT33_ZIZPA|nr:hypothetical protein GUJ93_ZPchr0012g20095 [Zizania palustris]